MPIATAAAVTCNPAESAPFGYAAVTSMVEAASKMVTFEGGPFFGIT